MWTTNFDGLVAKAGAMSGLNCIEIGLDSTTRIERPARKDELRIISLHGDYRYDSLKNTPDELKTQDGVLRSTLVRELRDTNLIVSGYSGRDKSVMDALIDAYSVSGSGRLYWCGYGDSEPPKHIIQLIETARSAGRAAFYVSTEGFDDTLFRLSSTCLTKERKAQMAPFRAEIKVKAPKFTVARERVVGFGKTNAFKCQVPQKLLAFELRYKGNYLWRELREATEGTGVIAVPFRKSIFCMGDAAKAAQVLKGFVQGTADYVETNSVADHSVIQSLLMHGLVRSLAAKHALGYTNKGAVYKLRASHQTVVNKKQCRIYEAAALYLRRFAGHTYILMKPTIRATALDGKLLSRQDDMELKRQELSGQYNKQFNEVLNQWIDEIFPFGTNVFEFPEAPYYRYEARRSPLFVAVGSASSRQMQTIAADKIQRFVSLYGEQVDEPSLLFTDTSGKRPRHDIFPLRGMANNRPYDYSLTQSGLATEVRIGVVSPAQDEKKLHQFLQQLNNARSADRSDEYWLDYPGFPSCFSLPLRFPDPGSTAWATCSGADLSTDAKSGAITLLERLKSCIDSVRSATSPNVILIYIPTRWKPWESVDSSTYGFDLHDSIKAYCVHQGVASQLIRESTLTAPYQSRIAWGLALQLYVKSMRTPWTLENISHNTAFVGLGYSMHADHQDKRRRIVLGCSHIYGSNGLGLQYKLRRIENPIMIQENPHMNYDDARRTAEIVRELFFESFHQLPNRVVFHKNTPFLREERQGLLDGLEGIENIDMIEVVIDSGMRFIASSVQHEKIHPDRYPVKRGTAIVIDDNKALVWVHGSTESVNPQRRYYLGKRRIPAPLLVTRHQGNSSLRTITRELLGLSKMDWNSVDMYNKMPATIQSAKKIAQIGSLLEGLQPQAYDYRLFI
ncbi:SIR2 family protein [Alicyclobacillus sp. SO9]|uniref:SIR2 family protein n=1 Tax=Alicyclobacillus sp. SO9 TaxID=2665646 RepID=UPI0018E76A02|nr:SIR2 family protein [Alicyclobacillus sp. SO9]QQE78379.1 SIR2 family protein [Alicyclobacillus sp. SO9]